MVAILRAVVCAALSGAFLYFSNGLGEIWPLAWIAPMPILWLAYGSESRRNVALAAFAAYAAGQMNLVVGYWGQLPFVALAIALIAPSLAFAVAVMFARFVAARARPVAAAFAFPAVWTAWEYLVAVSAPDGTAGSFAYSQAGVPEMIQTASVFGIWSITFLLMLNSSLLAMALRQPRRSRALAGLALVLFGANVLFGLYRLNADQPAEKIPVAMIASDALIKSSVSNDGVTALANVNAYITAARNAVRGGAQVVVMPEKLAVLEPAWREDALTMLRDYATSAKVTIVAGFDLRGETRRNVAMVFQPGQPPYEYDKRHMVQGLEAAFQPGLRSGVFAPGRATVVCKDMDFADTIRRDAQEHIRIMFVPAWDFGADGWTHARMAIMRGVENGFSIARSARDGFLTATDVQGRVIAGAPTNSIGFVSVSAKLPLGSGETLYRHIGDVFAWLCIGLTLVLTVLAFMSGRRERDAAVEAEEQEQEATET